MAVKFDPTINLGHILTFVGFIATGAAAYSLLEKRVAILEEKAMQAVVLSADQRQELKDTAKEIKSDLKDIQRTVNELSRTQLTRGDRR